MINNRTTTTITGIKNMKVNLKLSIASVDTINEPKQVYLRYMGIKYSSWLTRNWTDIRNKWWHRGNYLHMKAPVVQNVDSAIHWINLYLVDNAIGFPITYPLDSDYPMDSAIQRLDNRGLVFSVSVLMYNFLCYTSCLLRAQHVIKKTGHIRIQFLCLLSHFYVLFM